MIRYENLLSDKYGVLKENKDKSGIYRWINVRINREQYYIYLLKPEYNILKIAGSCLGFKYY